MVKGEREHSPLPFFVYKVSDNCLLTGIIYEQEMQSSQSEHIIHSLSLCTKSEKTVFEFTS